MIFHLGFHSPTKAAVLKTAPPFNSAELIVYAKRSGITTVWEVPTTITIPRLEKVVDIINFSNN